jgi:uncharacterized protein
MSELKKILESFCKIEGVKGAYLADKDGYLLEKTTDDELSMDSLQALLHESTRIGIDASTILQKDKLNQSYLEFEDMSLTSIILANDNVLTILSSSGVNLGRIRLEIRKNKKTIETMLE